MAENADLAGHGTLAERPLRPCVAGTSTGTTSTPCGKVALGQTAHWHSEYTLQKGNTDRHIALRAV